MDHRVDSQHVLLVNEGISNTLHIWFEATQNKTKKHLKLYSLFRHQAVINIPVYYIGEITIQYHYHKKDEAEPSTQKLSHDYLIVISYSCLILTMIACHYFRITLAW